MDSDTQQQPGLITSKLGSFTENLPEDITPESSVGESTDWFSTLKTAARAIGTANATLGTVDEYGRQTSAPEPDVDAKTLQEKYPQLPGQPAFDKPMPDSVASSIYEHQQDENRIADAKARRPAGFWNGAATIGTQFVADALDPLNIASMFVPVVGEGAFVAEGAGLAARIGGRAVAGAINTTAGQVPLVGLRYGQSKLENDDYSAWNAMSDLATGAAMGAFFHNLTGGVSDYLAGRMARSPVQTALEADPALRTSALNTAISQAASDNPVEVRPVFDAAGLHAATEARDNLLNDAAAVENIVPGSPAALRIQAIDEELGGSQRLAAIDAELGGVIPAARRESLEAERALVTQGEALPSLEHLKALHQERDHIIALEGARAEAQRSGLMDAASRSEADITSHLQAKHAEDYATLEQMAKDSGTDIRALYQSVSTAADAPLEDMERAYQQIRASEAAPNRALGGEQPGVPGPNAAAGELGAGQVVGATEPVGAGAGAPREIAGPAGGAGAAAGAGASAAERTRPVGELPTSAQGAIMYHGGTLKPGELPDSSGHVWLSADRATAEQFAAKSGGSVSEIRVSPGKYFDYRNPAALKLLKDHLDAIYGKGHGVDSDLDHGYFGGFDDPGVRDWLKANGYDGWFEHESMSGGPVSLGLIDQSKMQASTPQAVINPADLALRQKAAADAAQRAADGEPTAAEKALTAEAKAATKVEPSADMKQAQQEIDDHMQFFKAAEAAGALTDEDRVALQDLSKIDDDAKNRTNACLQAGACIARGLS